jgi:hypothetical protein
MILESVSDAVPVHVGAQVRTDTREDRAQLAMRGRAGLVASFGTYMVIASQKPAP